SAKGIDDFFCNFLIVQLQKSPYITFCSGLKAILFALTTIILSCFKNMSSVLQKKYSIHLACKL
ncbi:hypothetical protein, partial [Streptococcus pneumoniae]|uniref:hypothetical protein n=1 Tax=Streptococcus pneumoniae TaxID=1313 RepID=UPI00099E3487